MRAANGTLASSATGIIASAANTRPGWFGDRERHPGRRDGDAGGCADGGQHDAVRGSGDRRRVDHHAVDGVADALVVEGGHRQRVDAVEETRAVVVIEILGEPERVAEVEPAEQSAGQRETRVRFVLGTRLGVVTAGEIGVGGVALACARAERAHEQQQRHLQRRGPAEDLERRRVLEQRRRTGA